ncbi:MAG: alginate export family protein [Candidatus Omnitrophica bacterium]|nr:alginate export family protein [Candidatus Omnitrophota bacterium]
MRKTILLAFALAAFVAMPAMASVQNVKISGSIDSTWLIRNNFDLGLSLTEDEQQNLFITQSILRADADLTDNVSTTVALINERAWGDTSNVSTDIDLLLAYATLREMLYSPLTVVVGKQAFHYGNSFIVDSGGTNNAAPADSGIALIAGDLTKQTTQDAARFIFDYEPLSVELLFSKINSRTNTLAIENKDDIDLYGANVGYEVGDSMNTQVEAYFFAKVDKLSNTAAAGEFSKSDTVYVPGLRASTNPIEGLNVQAEVAWQRGNRVATTGTIRDNEQREAMGAQVIASYKVPVMEEYKPILGYVYTYVSGDSNPGDRALSETNGGGRQGSTNTYTAWDPMFENQAGGTIYNTLFNLSNSHISTVSAQVNPIEDVTAKVSWSNLRLDKGLRGNATNTTLTLVQPDGAASGTMGIVVDEKEIGNEIDTTLTYDYTEDVQFGANFGWFLPGDLFTGANNQVATQAIFHGNVNF